MSSGVFSLSDFERLAKQRLPASLFEYIASGAGSGRSLESNLKSFDAWALSPQVLVDVMNRTQSTTLLGTDYSSPIGIAPMGIPALCNYDGDIKLAAAAAESNVPYVLSGASTTRLEEVLRVNTSSWFQAYLTTHWEVTEPLLERVWAAGVRTLVVTVDVPIAATREAELRAGFAIPLKINLKLALGAAARPRWLTRTFARTLINKGAMHFENLRADRGGPLFYTGLDHRASRAGLTWEHIKRVRDHWKSNLIIKGILRPSDAKLAESIGVDGIIVSNHGGRQLDCSVSPMNVLSTIGQVAPRLTLMVDGGFRCGADVLKALALGAQCVFLGRPVMYGMAWNGMAGARQALELIKRDLDTNLALIGCAATSKLDRSYVTEVALPR